MPRVEKARSQPLLDKLTRRYSCMFNVGQILQGRMRAFVLLLLIASHAPQAIARPGTGTSWGWLRGIRSQLKPGPHQLAEVNADGRVVDPTTSDVVDVNNGGLLNQRGGLWKLPFGPRREPTGRELKHQFEQDTKQQVESLTEQQRVALDGFREFVYGSGVSKERVHAADQMVVWGVRDAMLMIFLDRKNWNLKVAIEQFDRILEWRLRNNIDDVLHRPTLPEEKILKHRDCWPTAFYMHKEGDHEPIFVDRMATLELDKLKKGPNALNMEDMLAYYVLQMEARRRLLFPKLSQDRGKLVCRYISVVDVSSFSAQHFGKDALRLMREMGRVFDEGNYSSLVGRLLIINVPWAFRQVWNLVKGMVSEELEARLMILSKKQAYDVIGRIVPAAMARDIIEGDHEKERREEAELHTFLDAAAKQRHHHKFFW